MVNNSKLQEAVKFLKENKCISIEYKDRIKLLFDAKNEIVTSSTSPQKGFVVLISSDRMANQCIKDIPEVAWDMMDYATTPLTLILDGGQFVSKNLLNKDGSLAIQKLEEGPLFELVSKSNKPIACITLDKSQPIQSDFKIVMEENVAKEKIMRIRLNGEIEILAN
ncbi:MAG: L-threonylcarbamoyladenylate synthase [Vicingaceae bacterium]|jgi:L-threonylcarbamoyladenylate synthase